MALVDRHSKGPGRTDVRRFVLTAMGVSFGAHALVLGIFALFGWESFGTGNDEIIDRVYISFEQPAPPPPPTTTTPPSAEPDPLDSEPEPELTTPDTEPVEQSVERVARTNVNDAPRVDDSVRKESVPGDYEEVREGGDDAEGDSGAEGGGARNEAEEVVVLPDVGFAGLGASNVRSVVYVVDASGPMVSTLANVVEELERSMLALDPAQEFQVVFVNGGGYVAAPNPEGSAGMIRALPSAVRGVAAWCGEIRAHGKPDPVPALEYALGLRADVVFLFSRVSSYIGPYERDREDRLAMLRARVLGRLDDLNPRVGEGEARRTVIKVVQFYDKDPSGLFRAIAAEHGGEGGYRFVTREAGSLR